MKRWRWLGVLVATIAASLPDLATAQGAQAPATGPTRAAAVRSARAAATTRPTTSRSRTTRRESGPAIPPAATTAVKELRAEFESGDLRSTSDYLTRSPNAELTTEVLLNILQRRCGDTETMDAYIKWQLLSGLPDKLTEEYGDAGRDAYEASPQLTIRPGMSEQDMRALDREARRVDDPMQLTGMLMNEVRRVDLLNDPVLKFRDELFARLPDGHDTFMLALKDLYDRGMSGISPRTHCRLITQRIAAWTQNAKPAEAASLYGAVSELLFAQMPEYYDSLQANRDAGGYTWIRRRAVVNEGGGGNAGQLDLTAAALENAARNAPASTQPSRRRPWR